MILTTEVINDIEVSDSYCRLPPARNGMQVTTMIMNPLATGCKSITSTVITVTVRNDHHRILIMITADRCTRAPRRLTIRHEHRGLFSVVRR